MTSRSRGRGARPPSVILVRESEEQLSGSGCCGRLEGEFLTCEDGPVFADRRAAIEAMGPVYRALRERFGDAVTIEVVDPRNLFSMAFLLLRDFWRYEVGVRDALTTIFRLPVQAVVVNGRLVARSSWPDPEALVRLVERAAHDGGRRPPRRERMLTRRS